MPRPRKWKLTEFQKGLSLSTEELPEEVPTWVLRGVIQALVSCAQRKDSAREVRRILHGVVTLGLLPSALRKLYGELAGELCQKYFGEEFLIRAVLANLKRQRLSVHDPIVIRHHAALFDPALQQFPCSARSPGHATLWGRSNLEYILVQLSSAPLMPLS
jgi:hypothetical protein